MQSKGCVTSALGVFIYSSSSRMARKRMIDPEFFLDDELAKLSPHARLLYIATWAICDDNFHTFPNRPDWIKTQTLPYENVDIPHLLKELEKSGKLIAFDHDGKPYYFIKNFGKYQRVEHPSIPKYPSYHGVLSEDSVSTRPQYNISKVNIIKSNTSSPAGDLYSGQFEDFWKAYPRKVGKGNAWKAWAKLKPSKALAEKIIASVVEHAEKDSQWKKDDGQFIPHPATFLNQRRFEDEVSTKSAKKVDQF